MALRQLRYVVALAEELHFGRAARRLALTQPPLSQAIRNLEGEPGVRLFERTRRRVALPQAGAAFVEEARATLARVAEAVERARRADRGEVGRLAVGFLAATAHTLLPLVLRDFKARFPGVTLDLRELAPPQLSEALRRREIQVGLVRPPVSDAELASEVIHAEPFVMFRRLPGRVFPDQVLCHAEATMESLKVRQAALDDEPFLWLMLYYAAHMDEQGLDTSAERNSSVIAKYVAGWGRHGDLGFIAVESLGNQPIGAAWLREFTSADPGHGFVGESIPELAIAVLPGHTGRGIGTALLQELLTAASQKYPGVSLNVRQSSPAARLYERLWVSGKSLGAVPMAPACGVGADVMGTGPSSGGARAEGVHVAYAPGKDRAMVDANPMGTADTPSRLITDDVFLAHLQCPYKAYLKLAGHSGTLSDHESSAKATLDTYRSRAVERMLTGTSPNDVTDYAGSSIRSLPAGPRLLLHGTMRSQNIFSHIDVLEKVPRKQEYAPVVFSSLPTISSVNRLLLGFKSLALSAVQGKDAPYGKIVHGSTFSVNSLALHTLWTTAGSVVAALANVVNGAATPRLLLNRHCNTCEFRAECRAKTIANDDVSLIQTLKPKDIAKLNKKGIFTITQYAFTFRPRRTRRRLSLPTKHDAALKALAIREKRIYVSRLPAREERSIHAFLDVEGLPNEDLYYLIGLSVSGDGDDRSHSFWADDKAAEGKMWKHFLGVLAKLGTYWIFHFGSSEARFVARMLKTYGSLPGVAPEDLQGSLRNVLTHYHLHIYLPTYSNGLKDVAVYFGFSWTSSIRSGADSILWRRRWEEERRFEVREQLVVYNREDCEALKIVTRAAISLLETDASDRTSVTPLDELKPEKRFRWGRNAFGVPAFEYINKCAYLDYQQAKIYWRTNEGVQRSLRRRKKRAQQSQRSNTTVQCRRPRNGVACRSRQVVNHCAVTRTIHDLRFSGTGVKRWIVRYVGQRYKCQRCGKTFYPADWPLRKAKYGRGFTSWIVYQSIGLRQ